MKSFFEKKIEQFDNIGIMRQNQQPLAGNNTKASCVIENTSKFGKKANFTKKLQRINISKKIVIKTQGQRY